MEQISDHPVVRCIERTGYPPWLARTRQGKWQFPFGTKGEDEDEQLHGGAAHLP